MKKWTMRVMGLLNVLFGLVGIWYFIVCLNWYLHKSSVAHGTRDWAIFSLLSFCTLSMVSSLAYLGIRLIILKEAAPRVMIPIFAAEILYFFFDAAFFAIIPVPVTRAEVGFWGLAASPIAPQIITGYPLLGIIVCVVLLVRGGVAAPEALP